MRITTIGQTTKNTSVYNSGYIHAKASANKLGPEGKKEQYLRRGHRQCVEARRKTTGMRSSLRRQLIGMGARLKCGGQRKRAAKKAKKRPQNEKQEI